MPRSERVTPVEEEELFREIQQQVGPELLAHYMISSGTPDLSVMASIGAKIQEICKAKGVESGWFIKYGLQHLERLEAAKKFVQAWGQPNGIPNLAKTKQEEDAKLKPYKCQVCGKRYVTSTERNGCRDGHTKN